MPSVDTTEMCNGTVDGANLSFSTPTPYRAGSLQPWVDGIAVRDFTETYPKTGAFALTFAPLAGSTVAATYREWL